MGNTNCTITHGKGEKDWWPWAECKVKSCEDGFEEYKGKCVILSGPCTPNPAVAKALTYVYNSDGVCVVEKCEPGYTLGDGKCTLAGSGSGSGSGLGYGAACTFDGPPCASPYKCLVSNVAAANPRCLTVESCAQAAEDEDSLENLCYGRIIIRGYSPTIYTSDYIKGSDGTSINSVEACSQYAASQPGATGFTWRTSKNDAQPNTCIAYGGVPPNTVVNDYLYKDKLQSGCVDKTKWFPNC